MKVWVKASIPLRLKKHVVKRVEEMFKEWAKVKKNKAKRSEGLQLKEAKWQEQLKGLFDIAHAEAMNITTIEGDKNFFLHKEKQAARVWLVQTLWRYTHNRPEVKRDKNLLSEQRLKQKKKIYVENNKYILNHHHQKKTHQYQPS